jgi:hypothetical protein
VERVAGNGVIQDHLGLTYARLGKKAGAVSVLRRASQLDPKLAESQKIADVIKELGGQPALFTNACCASYPPPDLLSPRLAAEPLSSNCGPLPRGGRG